MLKRLSDWLCRTSTGWVALAALIIFVLFVILVLPGQSAGGDQESGTPDLSLYYSPADLYRWAEEYGDDGRDAYVKNRFTFDVVWPLVYTLFLVTATSWVLGRALPPESPWQRANLVPILGALFDFLENLSTSVIMLRFPAQTPVLDLLAGVFTLSKWLLLGASFVLLLGGIVLLILKWVRNRQGNAGRG